VSKIIQFIMGNPILIIIILGGVFNAAVRIAQKTKDQRARREAFNEMARHKQDAMRTGRSSAPSATQSVQSQEDPEQLRRQRIEALRKERMEQLRAMREQRANARPTGTPAASTQSPPAPAQSTPSFTHPSLPPIPVQPKPQPTISPTPRLRSPQQTQRRPQIVVSGHQTHQPQRAPKRVRRQETNESTSKDVPVFSHAPARAPMSVTASERTTTRSARSMLRSRASVRQAIILSEILDAPIALRDQDIASGSIMSRA
jgi:hypothetical protein